MNKESERPTVEVGQRYEFCGDVYRVSAVEQEGSLRWARIVWERPDKPEVLQAGRTIIGKDYRFLGYAPGFAPGSRQAERRMMAVDARGNPASCLSCGAEKGVELLWFCSRCLHDSKIKCYELVAAWKEGARDFPRSTQSEPAPTAPHDQTLCTYCQGGIACPEFARMFKAGNVSVIAPAATPRAAVPPKRQAIPASCQLERFDETGPLSALQHIQARKPPEPWRPSVDEYDLLPDAGTSFSGSLRAGRGGR